MATPPLPIADLMRRALTADGQRAAPGNDGRIAKAYLDQVRQAAGIEPATWRSVVGALGGSQVIERAVYPLLDATRRAVRIEQRVGGSPEAAAPPPRAPYRRR